ncbi:hypothetical protein ACF0H5_004828 [Mactra antiquata]
MAYREIAKKVDAILSSSGFETYGFKIGWYNDCVQESFVFPYDYDTYAVLIVSTPDMFENGLVPFVLKVDCVSSNDILDEYMKDRFNDIKKEFSDYDVEAVHDFELLPSRRPKILVQTAGHVAGAAYYYQRKDVQPDPWSENKKIFGVSIHPKYGGWFAFRGALIFKNVLCPDLEKKEPLNVVSDSKKVQELLERFNGNWQDWSFRDIISVDKKYSEMQKEYFATLPKDRQKVIDKIKMNYKDSCTNQGDDEVK